MQTDTDMMNQMKKRTEAISTSRETSDEPIATRPPKRERQSRQGRTNLKRELIAKEWPLAKIANGAQILLELNRYRFMTNQQVADLLFVEKLNSKGQVFSLAGAKDAADLALKRLFESELIERKMVWQLTNPYNKPRKAGEARPDPTMVRAPVAILTREGARVVANLIEERDRPDSVRWTNKLQKLTDQNIAHELEVTDAAIAFRRAIATTEALTVVAWLDDQQLRAMARNRGTLMTAFTPDGLCLVECVTVSGTWLVPVFFEIDRQTETIRSSGRGGRDWKGKIGRYSRYLAREIGIDPLWRGLGLTEQEVKTLGQARVLTIAPTRSRARKLRDATKEAEGRKAYLFAAKEDIYGESGAILGPVWQSPIAEEWVELGALLEE